VVDTVAGYLKARVPASKIVVGLPFYGHGWTGVTDVNHGLYQAATGAAPGTWEAGTEDFKVLETLTGSGFNRYWDRRTQNAWLFDGTTFWTYDDARTIAVKAELVKRMRLGGMMFWELSGDNSSGTLVTAIAAGLDPDCHGHSCR
jgi:chitinase